MGIDAFLEELEDFSNTSLINDLDGIASDLCSSWSRAGASAEKRHTELAEQFYAMIPGGSRKGEELIMQCREELYTYTYILEYHAFHRGSEIAREHAKGCDDLQTIAGDYDSLIDYLGACEIGEAALEKIHLELDRLKDVMPMECQEKYCEVVRSYLEFSHARCGYYLALGYVIENKLLRYAYKDYEPPIAYTKALMQWIIDAR